MRQAIKPGRRILVVLAALAGALTLPGAGPIGAQTDGRADSDEVHVLMLVCNNYGANTHLTRDVFEQYGWRMTTTAITPTVTACADYGAPLGCRPIQVDRLLSEIDDLGPYDCLAVMPSTAWRGHSHAQLMASPEALAFIARAVEENLLVAAWCGGVRVLAAADVLRGRRITGHPHTTYMAEYAAAGAIYLGDNLPPVLDGNILTIRQGQTYCYEACEAIAAAVDSIRHAGTRPISRERSRGTGGTR